MRNIRPRAIHVVGVALVLLSAGLTLAGYSWLSTSAQQQSQDRFDGLARDSEQAILSRLNAHAAAIRSGAGIVQSSEFVSRAEWRTFAESLRLRQEHPGMLGLGWIEQVRAEDADTFVARVRADGAPNFQIHPEGNGGTLGVITYVEPEISNGVALGLDIEADVRSRDAARRAAETGLPALSRPMRLPQDEEQALGFLLLQAVYRPDLPLATSEQRRRAVRGYVYAALQASSFVAESTPEQDRSFDVAIFDGDVAFGELLAESRPARFGSEFSVRRDLKVHGRAWSLVWRSTPEFESAEYSPQDVWLLLGGMLFSGLLLLLLVTLSRTRTIDQTQERPRALLIPVITTLFIGGGAIAAGWLLHRWEWARVAGAVEGEVRHIDADVENATRQKMMALRRMAHRWASGSGTPYPVWRNDARDYLRQIPGLQQLWWIDRGNRLQWSEALQGETSWDAIGSGSDPKLGRALAGSAESGTPFVSAPREIAPGESGFSVHLPLHRDGRFDGFLTAIFSSRDFFREAMDGTAGSRFALAIKYSGVTFFDNGEQAAGDPRWTRVSDLELGDKRWIFLVSPTQDFIDAQRSPLPWLIAVLGGILALLAGFLVRYVLLAHASGGQLRLVRATRDEREKQFQGALAAMHASLWEWDFASQEFECEPDFARQLGFEAPRGIGTLEEFLDRIHPDERETMHAALTAHRRNGQPVQVEFRVRDADGDMRWIRARGEAVLDGEGRATRMTGWLADATDSRREQIERRRTAEQLRLLVGHSRDSVAILDAELRCLLSSPGWPPEQTTDSRWQHMRQRALNGETFERREDSWMRRDGEEEIVEWAIHPWTESDGTVGGVVHFLEVITPRKQAEAALLRSEAMNRAAIDKSPIGKALVHPTGRFLQVNPALCQLLGYSEPELLAKDFQSITHRDDLSADLAKLRALLEGRIPSYQMEKRYFHRDGRLIWAQLTVSLVRDAKGAPDFLVSQIQDITERKSFEDMKDEFVNVVRRELGAPVNEIREALGLIASQRDVELTVGLRRLLESSRANADRMALLVNDIHDLEQLEAGRVRFEAEDHPVAALTRKALLANETLAREHGVSLRIVGLDPSCVVYVDSRRVVQALSHLLSNAIRFSPSGGVVDIGAERRGGWVRLFVRDTGQGIPEDFRARIFGRFAQAEPGGGRQRTGAGLGLHIARRLVEQMHGSIGFVSHVGAGTTFWLDFPVVAQEDSAQGLC